MGSAVGFEEQYLKGVQFKQDKKYEEALQIFKECLSLDESNFSTYTEIYEVMTELKYEFKECLSYLSRYLEAHPDSQEALVYICKVAAKLDLQILVIGESISTLKNSTELFLSLGKVMYSELKDYVRASFFFAQYQIIVDLPNISSENGFLIGKCYHELKNENAYKVIKSSLEKQQSLELYQLLVKDFIQNHKIDEAFTYAKKELELYPNQEKSSLTILEESITKEINDFNQSINSGIQKDEQSDQFKQIQKNYQTIVDIYQHILERQPERIDVYKQIGLVLNLATKETDKVIDYYTKYIQHFPNDYQVLFRIGFIYFVNSNQNSMNAYDKAIDYFTKVVDYYQRSVNQLDINIGSLYFFLGESYLKVQQYENAILYMNKCQNCTQQYKEIISINIPHCLFKVGNIEKCLELLQESADETIGQGERMTLFFTIYQQFKSSENGKIAKECLKKLAIQNKNNFYANFYTCNILVEEKDYEQSLIFIEICYDIAIIKKQEISQQNPNLTIEQTVKFTKAAILKELNRIDESEQLALEIQKDSQAPEVLMMLADIYKAKGDKEKEQFYEEQFKLKQNDSINQCISIAKQLIDQKLYDFSLNLFEAAESLNSNNVSYYNIYGLALQKSGQLDKSIKIYETYLEKVSPDDIEVNYQLGCLKYQTNNLEEAKKYLKHCLNKQPSFTQAWQQLSILYKSEQNFTEAINCLETILKENPQSLETLIELMDIEHNCLGTIDIEKFRGHLEKAQAIDPENQNVKKYALMIKLNQF